jgi:hypothetical protein
MIGQIIEVTKYLEDAYSGGYTDSCMHDSISGVKMELVEELLDGYWLAVECGTGYFYIVLHHAYENTWYTSSHTRPNTGNDNAPFPEN